MLVTGIYIVIIYLIYNNIFNIFYMYLKMVFNVSSWKIIHASGQEKLLVDARAECEYIQQLLSTSL